MSVPVERWVVGGTELVVVDAAEHVPDRRAFAAAHCDDEAPSGTDPGGVLFLAPDAGPTPPRVVTTLVRPDGRSTVGADAVRVAAAWTARRTVTGAVMVDTPRGTHRAAVAARGPGSGFAVTVDRAGTATEAAVERAGGGTLASVAPRRVE